jgi:hypothetical protein
MNRVDNFTLRVNATERELIAAVAQKLERGESDTLRLLVRREAQRLGIAPTNSDRRPNQAGDSA